MRGIVPEIRSAGANLVVVGNGTPDQAKWFVEDLATDIPVFTDPGLSTYEALGTRSGWLRVLHPRFFVRAWQALRSGQKQSKLMGSATQMGGVFLIMPDGSLPWAYRSRFNGDHPEPTVVLDAVLRSLQS